MKGVAVALLLLTVLAGCGGRAPAADAPATDAAAVDVAVATDVDAPGDGDVAAETDVAPPPDASIVDAAAPDAGDDVPDAPAEDAQGEIVDGDGEVDAVDAAALADLPPDAVPDAAVAELDVAADAASDEPEVDATPTLDAAADGADAADAMNPPADVTCDAGDEEWVRRAMSLLAGRKPYGIREVRVVAQLVQKLGRGAVAQAMMHGAPWEARWIDHLYDTLRVGRVAPDSRALCSDVTQLTADNGEWATWVRDHTPMQPAPTPGGTLRDLMISALRLDDLRPFVRGRLMAELSAADEYSKFPDKAQIEATRRTTIGERFLTAYLGRNLSCLQCHNSVFGVGDNPVPAADHHWPIEGSFEASLFGDDTGRPPAEVLALFRYHDVVSIQYLEPNEQLDAVADPSPPVKPWGWAQPCGVLRVESDVPEDPLGINAYFGGPLGKNASVWSVEAMLQGGMAQLATWPDLNDTVSLSADPQRALAWLTAARIVDATWTFAMGHSLNEAHGFPRNPWQRARLKNLTVQFIAANWSLRTLLTAIALDPTFNPLPPSAGCGVAYAWPPLFQPYAVNELDPAVQGNGPGDALHRENAAVLMHLAAVASGRQPVSALIDFDWAKFLWPQFPLAVFPTGKLPAVVLSAGIGAYLSGLMPGFNQVSYGFLANWRELVRTGTPALPNGAPAATTLSANGDDWYDQLGAALATDPTATLRDVVVAAQDRFWSAPDVAAAVEAPTAAFFAVASLDVAIGQVPNLAEKVREYCGLLMADAQFYATPLALPVQSSTPKLVVGDTSTAAACAHWAALLVDPQVATLDCASGQVLWVAAPP